MYIVQQNSQDLHLPNILAVAPASSLRGRRNDCVHTQRTALLLQSPVLRRRTGSYMNFAEMLRSKGYYTALSICHVLSAEEELPLTSRGFDSTFTVFWYGPDSSAGKPLDGSSSCARRLSELNEEVIARALDFMTRGLQNQKPFFIVCGIDVPPYAQEYIDPVSRLHQRLLELQLDHNTMLLNNPCPLHRLPSRSAYTASSPKFCAVASASAFEVAPSLA